MKETEPDLRRVFASQTSRRGRAIADIFGMINRFRVQVLADDKDMRAMVKIAGAITEHAEFQGLTVEPYYKLEVDLAEVTSINSIGITGFRTWSNRLKNPFLRFSFCPKCVVLQLNMIRDFLPDHAKVVSFYVPYFSENGEEKPVLYREGLEFTRREDREVELKHPAITDSAGVPMEPDIIPERYFSFLQRYT